MRLFHNERRLYESRHGETLVQVFEKGDRRELRFGNRIVQSAQATGAPDVLVLEYTRAMMAGFLVATRPEYILHLGLGAGCLPRFIHRFDSTVRQRVVEINPGVIDVAYRLFDLPLSSRLMVSEGEAVGYLGQCRDQFDLIFVDVFGAEGPSAGVDVPSFFTSLDRHLNRDGWVVNNVWGSNREQLKIVTGLMASTFKFVYSIPVHSHSNVILIGGSPRAVPTVAALKQRAMALSRHIPLDFGRWPTRMQLIRED